MPDLFILAEGGGSGGNVPMLILVAALAAFAVAYFIVGPGRGRSGPQRRGDIPLSMRPYHSDEELETTGMERAMAWGVALAVFSALFLPIYWVIEPARINQAVEDQYQQDVTTGRGLFADACASCHGTNLEGGSAPHPNQDIEAPWPAPTLHNIVARYQDSEVVPDVREFIRITIERGRSGTPMPAFGVAYGGQYSDQQINAMVSYILAVQTGEVGEAQAFEGASGEDLFGMHCATCHGQNAEGNVGPQLLNFFARYGWTGEDDDSLEQARAVAYDTLINGRNVPGKAPMPSFSQVLTDEAIETLIDYIESFQVMEGPRFAQIGGDPDPADDDGDDAATEENGS
jgi:mono/diheme cytochrome c family protein